MAGGWAFEPEPKVPCYYIRYYCVVFTLAGGWWGCLLYIRGMREFINIKPVNVIIPVYFMPK